MSSNLGQIPPLTTELAARELQKFDVLTFFQLLLTRTFLYFAGKDNHKILDEFEIQPITDYGVSCPWASKLLIPPLVLGYY